MIQNWITSWNVDKTCMQALQRAVQIKSNKCKGRVGQNVWKYILTVYNKKAYKRGRSKSKYKSIFF